MLVLYKPTEMKRRTVPPTGRVLLHAAPDAPELSHRRVLILMPTSPGVSLVVGPNDKLTDPSDIPGIDDSGADPEDIAEGRFYQWPEAAGAGEIIKIHLAPENWISAMSREGMANVALVVEYHRFMLGAE
jgi:hypothetical protein